MLSKFLLKALLLICMLSGMCCLVICYPGYTKKFGYNHEDLASVNQGKTGWVYARFSRPVTYAFVGSSRTLNGVDDSLIQRRLRDAGVAGDVANTGRSWPGRNLDYVFIKDLLSRQKPAVIFLEVHERIPKTGNVIFPIVADWQDLFHPVNFLKPLAQMRDLHTAFRSRIDGIASTWFPSREPATHLPFQNFGYLPHEGRFSGRIGEGNFYERAKDRFGTLYMIYSRINRLYYDFYMRLILDLAARAGTEVIFLYLPSYRQSPLPEEYQLWSKRYLFWIPPASILNDPSNFCDLHHLNPRGAEALSNWLAERLVLLAKGTR